MINTKIYKDVYAAMDACNAGAIAHSASEDWIPAIWAEAKELGRGTDYVNEHPIMILLADKLLQLARPRDIMDAYKVVRERGEA